MTRLMVHDRPYKLDRRIFECDDDDIDESGLLREGRRVRIRVADRETAEDENYVTDAFGAPAGHRPGYVFASDDAAQRRLDDAYAEGERALNDAWRSPGSGARVAPALGARVAAGSAQDALDRAYDEYDELLTNAWRGDKALSPGAGASANAVEDPDEERRRAFNPTALPPVVTAHVAAPARGNNRSEDPDDEDVYATQKRMLSNAWRSPGSVAGPWGAR